jgi:hypothetical protein
LSFFAPSACIPPYWFRHRFHVDSRSRDTAAPRSGPYLHPSMRSPSWSFRTASSGVCRCLSMWSSPHFKGMDSHNRWTTIQGSGQVPQGSV